MVAPNVVSQAAVITGTSDNSLIDAMLITKELLEVPVIQRGTINGATIVKWGGEQGTGAELTFSFFDAASTFPVGYPGQYIEEIGIVPEYVKEAFRIAVQAWADVVNINFLEVVETAANVGDVRIGVSLSNPNFAPGNSSAEAVPPAAQSSGKFPGLHAGDIYLSSDLVAAPAANFAPGQFKFMTVMHELGHAAIGLGDVTTGTGWNGKILPAEYNYRTQTIMSYSVVPGSTVGDAPIQGNLSYAATTPMILDILAAQWLYGANMSKGAGDDVYTFLQSKTYHETIWDAGGIDTINAEDVSSGVNIDLRPGTLSDVGSEVTAFISTGPRVLSKTVGIAFGAIIENAVGGSGSDILTGNQYANQITGNGGNDTIDTGAGIDTVIYSGNFVDYTLISLMDGSYTVTDNTAGRDGIDIVMNAEKLQFLDQTIDIAPISFAALFAGNASQAKGISAVYEVLLKGVPNIAGFTFLINSNNATNFGAGLGPIFNDENIYINIANALVQGNPSAATNFNSIAGTGSLTEQVTAIYKAGIPASNQSAEGLAFITRPDGLKFYQDVAFERGIVSDNGPGIIAFASLLKIAVDGNNGVGNAVTDLLAAVADGSAALPDTGTTVLPIETVDGTKYDADDASTLATSFAALESGGSEVGIIGYADAQDDALFF